MATFGTFVAGQVLTAAELNTAGTWQDYTPTWTQSATITKTTNWARYTQLGKWVQGSIKMTASSAGTANNEILVGLPVSASTNNYIMGGLYFFPAVYVVNTVNLYNRSWFAAVYKSSSTMSFLQTTANNETQTQSDLTAGWGLSAGPSISNRTELETIRSGDVIYIEFAYEAA